jgi:hypothetical protein
MNTKDTMEIKTGRKILDGGCSAAPKRGFPKHNCGDQFNSSTLTKKEPLPANVLKKPLLKNHAT